MRMALLCLPGPSAPGPDLAEALAAALGAEELDAREDGRPLHCDAVLVTAGAAAMRPGDRDALQAFAAAGGAVLGLGGGFAALCQAGLLPGSVAAGPAAGAATGAESGSTPGAVVHVRVEGRATPFTWAIPAGRVVRIGGAAPTARYLPPAGPALEVGGHVILRYCDAAGGIDDDHESPGAVAGICDAGGRVVGLLPRLPADPEAFAAGLGRQLIASLRLAAAGRWP